MTIVAVGVSYKNAPVALREMLAVPEEKLAGRLHALRGLPGVHEALILSTCNRFEIFVAAESWAVAGDVIDLLDPAAARLAICTAGADAVQHLFRVAASLDSMVVGEAQILGQVKDAAARADAAGTLGPELRRALASATRAARRVRSETGIAQGAVSLSSVAAELAEKLLGKLDRHPVLLLGAGEMGKLAARELRARGVSEILVANRTSAAAEALAKEVSGKPVPLSDLPYLLERVDAVVASTGADHHLVTREMVERASRARRSRPLFLVDLSLPRNVEPSANDLENTYVYDLDDLERVAVRNREVREGEVEAAEGIVGEELQEHLAREEQRSAVPAIRRLRARAEAVAQTEAEKALRGLGGLDERQSDKIRAMAAAIVNKLLHEPTVRLRAEAGKGPLQDAALELFGLVDEPAAPSRPLQLVAIAGNA